MFKDLNFSKGSVVLSHLRTLQNTNEIQSNT